MASMATPQRPPVAMVSRLGSALEAAASQRERAWRDSLSVQLAEVVDEYNVVSSQLEASASRALALERAYIEATRAYAAGVGGLWTALCAAGAAGDDDARRTATRLLAQLDATQRVMAAMGLEGVVAAGGVLSLEMPPQGMSPQQRGSGRLQPQELAQTLASEEQQLAAEARAAAEAAVEAAEAAAAEAEGRARALAEELESARAATSASAAASERALSDMRTALALMRSRAEAAEGALAAEAEAAEEASDLGEPQADEELREARAGEARAELASEEYRSAAAALARSNVALVHELEQTQERHIAQGGVLAMLREQVSDLATQLNTSEMARAELARRSGSALRAAEERAASARRELEAVGGSSGRAGFSAASASSPGPSPAASMAHQRWQLPTGTPLVSETAAARSTAAAATPSPAPPPPPPPAPAAPPAAPSSGGGLFALLASPSRGTQQLPPPRLPSQYAGTALSRRANAAGASTATTATGPRGAWAQGARSPSPSAGEARGSRYERG